MTTAATPSTTDLVVVLPGVMGSVLGKRTKSKRAADSLVWAPSAGAAIGAIRNFLGRAPKLALKDGIGDEAPDDGVEPIALMPDFHVLPGLWTPILGYDQLVRFLNRLGFSEQWTTRPPNLMPVPYDWRLSCRHNGDRLRTILEPALDRWRGQGGQYQDARLVFVCHSMGGLVARWYIEKCGGAEITRKLITLGTPWRGAGLAVDKLSNGVPIKIGPFDKLRLDAFARSLPSLYQLLPEYACVHSGTEYLKTTETTLPNIDAARAEDAMRFHTDLQEAENQRPDSKQGAHMLVGIRQPTMTTFEMLHGTAVPSETFGIDNEYGDGTVPLTGAIGHHQAPNTSLIARIADQHGNLQCNSVYLDTIQEIITAAQVRRRADKPYELRVSAPDLITAGEDLLVTAQFVGDYQAGLKIAVRHESGATQTRQPRVLDRQATARFPGLAPGGYTVEVGGLQPGTPVNPVVSTTLVWDPSDPRA